MRWLAVVVLVVCSAVASCGGGDRPPPQRPSAGCAQRLPLETFLRVPDGPRRPRVLLLALHGARQSGPDLQRYSGLTSAAGNVIVAYPRSPHDDGFWRVSDVSRLLALVRAIGRCVPVARVAAVGFSNGGLMANALACRAARRVRAIVLVSAGYRNLGPCHPAQPVSVLAFHGTRDAIVPYAGFERFMATWARRDGCAPPPRVHARAVRDAVRVARVPARPPSWCAWRATCTAGRRSKAPTGASSLSWAGADRGCPGSRAGSHRSWFGLPGEPRTG